MIHLSTVCVAVGVLLLVTASTVVTSEQTLASTSVSSEIQSDTVVDTYQLLDVQTEEENETGSNSDIDRSDGETRPLCKNIIVRRFIFIHRLV